MYKCGTTTFHHAPFTGLWDPHPFQLSAHMPGKPVPADQWGCEPFPIFLVENPNNGGTLW